MHQLLLAASGNFTQTLFLPGQGFFVSYQQGARVIVARVSLVRDVLQVGATWPYDMGGAAGGFPRLGAPHGVLAAAWRRGAPPYLLVTNLDGHTVVHDFEVHGSYPCAFGGDFLVFQDTADFRLRRARLPVHPTDAELKTALRDAEVLGHGRGTGIAAVQPDGTPLLVDFEKARPPVGVYKCRVGDVEVREADGAHGPEVQAVKDDGRRCAIWPGQESTFPWGATDGAAYLIGTEGAHAGVRVALLDDADFTRPPATPEPFGVRVDAPKALGYFFERGRPGEWNPKRNCTVTSANLWQGDTDGDGDQELPADIDDRLARAIDDAGVAFLAHIPADFARPAIRDRWSKVLGVWTHEPDTAAMARDWVEAARADVAAAGLPARPIITILVEGHAANPAFAGIGDALAPEIYFANPEPTYDQMLGVARARIDAVCRALAPSPLFLCIQAFDRIAGGTQWKDAPWAVEAIQQAANEALVRDQVLGLWWFAYGRLGGTMDYPQWARWHAAQVAVTPAPKPITTPTVPKPPPKPEDPMSITPALIRRYIGELQDPNLFGALQRYHDEVVLPRDKPLDGAIKSAAWTAGDLDFWTGDVTTGGANAYFVRAAISEYIIARHAGQDMANAMAAGFEAAKRSYQNGPGKDPQ